MFIFLKQIGYYKSLPALTLKDNAFPPTHTHTICVVLKIKWQLSP